MVTLPTTPNLTDPRAPTEALPRPLTPRARRQSWQEPAVRAWWLVALAIALVLAFQVTLQLAETHQVRRRLTDWRLHSAKIDRINASARATYTVEPDTLAVSTVEMTYTDATGAPHALKGPLLAQLKPKRPGDTVDLLVDPADPSVYTDRVRPTPLIEELIIPIVIAPFPLLFAIVAFAKRRRALTLWRDGQRRRAEVVDVTRSAISPRSSVVRCTVPTSRHRRLFRLTIPRRLLANPRKGDPLDVITPSGEPTRAIAAMLYEGTESC